MEFVLLLIGALAYWNFADYFVLQTRGYRETLCKALVLEENAWRVECGFTLAEGTPSLFYRPHSHNR